MSTDPTGLDGKNCIASTSRKYLNFSLCREDWCTYKGDCLINDVLINGSSLCLFCKYKKSLYIPQMLKTHKEKQYEIK